MLRRDITPEEIIRLLAAVGAHTVLSVTEPTTNHGDLSAEIERLVRALFETEAEPTPPAGSEHSLLNEIALLRGHLDISRQHNATRWTEICSLRAEVERLNGDREDAARYRYLKSRVVRPFIDPPDNMWRMALDLPYPKTATGRTFDETIDAARTAGEGRDG